MKKMREILFRGKRIDNGEWVEATGINKLIINLTGEEQWFLNSRLDSSVYFNEQGHLLRLIAAKECTAYRIDLETLGQYTGLTDRNGKKIFEGDICRVCLDPEICVGVVEYDERTASFIIKVGETKMLTFLDYMIAKHQVGDRVWIERIGNIHDNPELLEVNADG